MTPALTRSKSRSKLNSTNSIEVDLKLLKSLILVTVIAYSLPGRAEPLDLKDRDKQLHVVTSYAINTTILAAVPKETEHRRLYAALATMGVGIAKEFIDPKFSGADVAADALGVATSTAFSYVFEF